MPPEFIAFLQSVDGSALAQAMRKSRWLYPAVNTGHVVGIALIVGAILPLDLRLLGVWRHLPFGPLARVLIPTAVAGIALAAVTGALLFTVDPIKYATLRLFQVKLGLIGLAILNALVLRAELDWPQALGSKFTGTTPRLMRAGVVSAVLWLGALICGRLVGYV